MDRHEFQIKSEQIEKLYQKKDFATAAEIADTVDWRKTRNVALLTEVADIYEKIERYEDSYEILNIAYDNSPIGRMIVYKMVEVAVKLKDFDEAVSLYKEFVKVAPHDLGRYVLKYEIYKGRGAALEDQIAILEEYKSREYQEQWAYELASLYYQQGMYSKCVEECDDLILWFSEGEYVTKAMELKMRIQPLTASQEEKYRQMVMEGKAEEIEVKPVNTGQFNTANLQQALAEGIKDYLDSEDPEDTAQTAETPRYTTRNTDVNLPDIAAILEKTGKISLPEGYVQEQAEKPAAETADDAETAEAVTDAAKTTEAEDQTAEEAAAQENAIVSPQIITGGVDKETAKLPRYLGETDTGQLTFDMEENVIGRQITGQLSIEDVLKDWEEKKKEAEAAIAEAAIREEKKREERRRLRETGQLPDPMSEVKETLPEEIKRLIEEIEDRIPVKVHMEPLDSDGKAEEVIEAVEGTGQEPVKEESDEGLPEIIDILEMKNDGMDIFDILEEKAEEPEVRIEMPEELGYKTEEIPVVEEAPAENEAPAVEKAEEEAETELAGAVEEMLTHKDEPISSPPPMFKELEESLEASVSTLPPGQLTEEQKKLFAYFTSVRGMNQQLVELLEHSAASRTRRDDSLTGNIVITGKRGTGKTTLAADIVKALQKQRRVKGSRMAKVTAESLDGKDVSLVVSKLGGGALLVERAGNMKTETAIQLSHAMTRKTGGLLVILEDEKKEIDELFTRCESLGAKFTQTIDIPVFTNKELVAFGESYALENECVLDEMAMLALYNKIGQKQTSDHLVNVAEVKEMIDDAIAKGGKKGLFGKTKKSRLDEFGNTVLLEKDFEE